MHTTILVLFKGFHVSRCVFSVTNGAMLTGEIPNEMMVLYPAPPATNKSIGVSASSQEKEFERVSVLFALPDH